VLPVLIAAGEKHVSEVSGVKQGTVRYVLKGRSPRLAQRGKLLAAADRIAREGLASADREVPLTMTGRLSLWLSLLPSEQRTCHGCGWWLSGRQQKWCDECAGSGQRRKATTAPRHNDGANGDSV
jgi:hypothetical protein